MSRLIKVGLSLATAGFGVAVVEAAVMSTGWTSPAWLGFLFVVLCPAIIPATPAFVEQDPGPGTPQFYAIWAFVAIANAILYAAVCFVLARLFKARRSRWEVEAP